MTYENIGPGRLDYQPCSYGASRLAFRGPKKTLSGDYVAFLGGTETYGKFIADPFPELLEAGLGLPCVNFANVNAGLDMVLHDPFILEAARRSRVTVLQVMGAQNMSNRFYRVHPRRNDRFTGASAMMRMAFREVDFTEFNFTRHMLGQISARAPERFALLRDELRRAWTARMKLLLETIGGAVVLLWMSRRPSHQPVPETEVGEDPLFVDAGMIADLQPLVAQVVEVTVAGQGAADPTEGMICADVDKPAARQMPGPVAHEAAARALEPVLRHLLQ